MGSVPRALLLSLIGISCIECPAQVTSNLELRLQAEPAKPTAPRIVSLVLVNKTDHDVYVPQPSAGCEDGYNGWFEIFRDFKSLRGKADAPYVGEGCAADRGGPWPSILDRVRGSVAVPEPGWKVLRSGAAMTIKAGIVAFNGWAKAGTYELWATYASPSILSSDRSILAENKIDTPVGELQSNHLIILKKK